MSSIDDTEALHEPPTPKRRPSDSINIPAQHFTQPSRAMASSSEEEFSLLGSSPLEEPVTLNRPTGAEGVRSLTQLFSSRHIQSRNRAPLDAEGNRLRGTFKAPDKGQDEVKERAEEMHRLQEDKTREKNWKRWGPYLSERQVPRCYSSCAGFNST